MNRLNLNNRSFVLYLRNLMTHLNEQSMNSTPAARNRGNQTDLFARVSYEICTDHQKNLQQGLFT